MKRVRKDVKQLDLHESKLIDGREKEDLFGQLHGANPTYEIKVGLIDCTGCSDGV